MNKDVLAQAPVATAEKRGSSNLIPDAEKVLCDIHDSKDMQGLWDNYRTKFSYAKDISWNTVIRSVRQIAIEAGLSLKKPSALEHLADYKDRTEPAKKRRNIKLNPQNRA